LERAILALNARRINSLFACRAFMVRFGYRKELCCRPQLMNALRLRRTNQTFGRWPVVAMIDWIDATHRFLAALFFDDMRDQSRRARDHENAVECRRIHSQIG
jgi:hypothetical protein